jgi:hypothetical protein
MVEAHGRADATDVLVAMVSWRPDDGCGGSAARGRRPPLAPSRRGLARAGLHWRPADVGAARHGGLSLSLSLRGTAVSLSLSRCAAP